MHVRKYRTWEEFLGLAVLTGVHIHNCLPSQSHDDMSPRQHWTGKEPGVGHLRVLFGSTTFVHIPKEKRCKLDTKSVKCILVGLGYEENAGSKVYRLDDTANKKIVL